jgi:hypothetical protein
VPFGWKSSVRAFSTEISDGVAEIPDGITEIPDGITEIPEGLEGAPFKSRNVPFHRVDARDHAPVESDRASVICPAAGVYKACSPVDVHPAWSESVKNRTENCIQITSNRWVLRVGSSRIMGSIFVSG